LQPASAGENEPQAAVTALAKSTRLGREMHKLVISYKPYARETMNTQPIIVADESGEKVVEQINFCFDAS
jgi:hypothetical protein